MIIFHFFNRPSVCFIIKLFYLLYQAHMLHCSSYQEWLLLIHHHPQILIAYPNRRLIFDRLFVEIGYIICRLDNTKTIPFQNILPLSFNNNITVLSLQMQLYWVALCCFCSGVALILGPNGPEDVIRERAADCKHEKSIHFFEIRENGKECVIQVHGQWPPPAQFDSAQIIHSKSECPGCPDFFRNFLRLKIRIHKSFRFKNVWLRYI